jgi:lipoate-protein ligase A
MDLRVLPFLEGDAGLQMELDRYLLDTRSGNGSTATVRFYRIVPQAITIGHHQNESSLDGLALDGSVEVVRRPTGGRAVIHSGDLTYSLVGALDGSVFGTATSEVYRAISRGVKRGIEAAGIVLDLIGSSGDGPSPLCFRSGSRDELSYRGRKICGGALLRRDGRFLFQGSILVAPPAERFRPQFAGMANLTEIAGRRLEMRDLGDMIVEGFEGEFQARIGHRKWPMDLLDKKALLW